MSLPNPIRASSFATVTISMGIFCFGVAGPALATEATFTVTPGTLSITVPTDIENLGSVESSGLDQVISGPSGSVTVTDTRGGRDTTWAAMVSSTDFGTAYEALPTGNIGYFATLSGTGGPGAAGASVTANALPDISIPRAAVAAKGLHGNNAASWNSTIEVRVPANTMSGVYSGVITHSVA